MFFLQSDKKFGHFFAPAAKIFHFTPPGVKILPPPQNLGFIDPPP